LQTYHSLIFTGDLKKPLTAVTREREAGQPELIAEGYEQTVTVSGKVKRTTSRPTAEALLGAFQGIHLSFCSKPT
jgi:hypothetical protein